MADMRSLVLNSFRQNDPGAEIPRHAFLLQRRGVLKPTLDVPSSYSIPMTSRFSGIAVSARSVATRSGTPKKVPTGRLRYIHCRISARKVMKPWGGGTFRDATEGCPWWTQPVFTRRRIRLIHEATIGRAPAKGQDAPGAASLVRHAKIPGHLQTRQCRWYQVRPTGLPNTASAPPPRRAAGSVRDRHGPRRPALPEPAAATALRAPPSGPAIPRTNRGWRYGDRC